MGTNHTAGVSWPLTLTTKSNLCYYPYFNLYPLICHITLTEVRIKSNKVISLSFRGCYQAEGDGTNVISIVTGQTRKCCPTRMTGLCKTFLGGEWNFIY